MSKGIRMLAINQYEGERLSFFQIFSNKNYKVIVPILQRDYAQGRTNDDVSEVRNEFLEALFSYLDDNRPNRDLDFIYGTLQQDDQDERLHFIPLDGQQRLTTLFLLHWFLFQISKNEEAKERFRSKLMKGSKSLFSYETRQSSSEFCDALMASNIDMENLRKVIIDGEEVPSLSRTIQNESWFFRSWMKDPTIKSMLVMLDAIYLKFKGREEFFERLLNEESPIITFIFMDLKAYKLNDELYIKMNSRGKPLTKFENFKAKFEKFLNNFDSQKTRSFKLKFSNKWKKVSLKEYFSYNIDTKWTNLIWRYCRNGKQHLLDSYLENLFKVLITNYFATIAKTQNKKDTDNVFDVLMNNKSISFSGYESLNIFNADSIEPVLSIVDSLDALCNTDKKLISEPYKFYYDEEEVFRKARENTHSRSERLRFFAYVQYIIRHGDKLEGLDQWMRVIHNLTHPENTIIDDNEAFSSAIYSIEKLLPFAPRIIEHLQKSTIDGYFRHQGKEECLKAKLFANHGWQELIEQAEKHPYFNGQIGFLLEFSGVCEYEDKNKNVLWSEEQNANFMEKFSNYSAIGRFIFDLNASGERYNDTDYCFERAVLTQGNYLLSKNPWYKNLLSTETVEGNVKRDLSWKRMLRMRDKGMEEKKKLVKTVFDNIQNLDDISGSLRKLCIPKTKDHWRNCLIASPELIKACKKGFIYFGDEILLLNKTYLNHYHWELFTYKLWLDKFKYDDSSFRFFSIEYKPQKRSDESPYILLNQFCYKRNKYEIQIFACLKDDEEDGLNEVDRDFKNFEITFGFQNENKSIEDCHSEILDILSELKFKILKDNNWFSLYCNKENKTYETVKTLVERLCLLNNKKI